MRAGMTGGVMRLTMGWMACGLMSVVATVADAGPPARSANPGNVAIFPARGQSPDQQRQDESAAYDWATQQTGWDPYQAQAVLGLEQRGVEVAHQPLAIDRLPAVGAAQQAAEPAFVGDQQMLALLLEALDQLGRQGGNSGGGTAVQSRYRSG